MYTYILILPSAIAAVLMIVYLHRLRKHDEVLFQFCQNRREIMTSVRKENVEFSPEAYKDVRHILSVTNDTIHYFNECKPHHFNLRRFVEYMISQNVMNEEPEEEFASPEIEKFYEGHISALLNAFFAFTPFIKSEIVLRMAVFLAQTVGRLGIVKLKHHASEWAEVFSWVKKEANDRNLLYN